MEFPPNLADDPYYHLAQTGPYAPEIGSALITMVEPHVGHEMPVLLRRRPDTEWTRVWSQVRPNSRCGESDPVACFSRERLLKDVFLDSDTSLAVLSHVPAIQANAPLTHEDAIATKRAIDLLDGTERLFLHAAVNPAEAGALERMEAHAKSMKLAGFKTYTDPTGFSVAVPEGWGLDSTAVLTEIALATNTSTKATAVRSAAESPSSGSRRATSPA